MTPGGWEFEYSRGGTLAYVAAYDVHNARVIGRTEDKTGGAPFGGLVDQVMTTEPCASADRPFWAADNGSSYAGQTLIDRMHTAWPNAHLLHLAVHALRLNQVEIYLSILRRLPDRKSAALVHCRAAAQGNRRVP